MKHLFIALQHILPHHFLSAIQYRMVRVRWRWWKNLMIKVIGGIYRIDLGEAVRQSRDDYVHFNDFFTRELKPGARALADEPAILCPADGAVSAMGGIDGASIFQAKGRSYSLEALLGGRSELAERFRDGQFATIYLAPHNYHRVHIPLAGRLRETLYVPGRLFSVSPVTVANVDRLFARNERLVTLWDTDHGPMAVILVGAMLVSSIETVWHGEYAKRKHLETACFENQRIVLERGAELGRFNMGSTVILLLGNQVKLADIAAETEVRMGEEIGRV